MAGKINMDKILKTDILSVFKKMPPLTKGTPKPQEYKKPVIVFDIGQKNIKVLIGKHQKEGIHLLSTFSISTPADSLLDGKVLNEAVLGNAIKVALKGRGIRIKDALVTTNSSQIINRELVIEKVDEDELETVIRYELQHYLPINLNDYLVQFTILEEFLEDEVTKYKIFVIAFPDRIANSYYQVLKTADLRPISLETTFISLDKLLNNTMLINQKPFNREGITVFIDLGATTIDVHIYKNGRIDLTRLIKSGTDDIDQMLSSVHKIHPKSTLKVKKELDLMNQEDEMVQTTRRAVDNLAFEIDRILHFYRNKSYAQINKIYLYGGGATLNGMDTYMAEQLKLEVETVRSFNNIECDNLAEFLNALGSMYRH